MILQGEHIQLKNLIYRDVTQKYVNWMNDLDVTKYTESRFIKHTIESVTDYVKAISGSSEDYFYGIYEGKEHIGNIKLHTNMHHRLGDLGIIVGDKSKWGCGYATEAINIVTKHGFNTLELHKISAGVYSNNLGSIKAFQKAGYEMEGLHKATYLSDGNYVDEIIMSKWNE
jgi:[ribosomal protein S5]-alanine N-acetyltransferase